MKHEWRKQEKNLYMPKQKPELITVPEQKKLKTVLRYMVKRRS